MKFRSEWLLKNLDYRLSGLIIDENKFYGLENKVPRLAVHNADEFLSLNDFSNRILMSSSGVFEHIEYRKEFRYVDFSNYVKAIGTKTPFLVNWCDAQGWLYSKLYNDLPPVFQFSRRKEQREYVNLFPLGREFMGFGGKNIPNLTDPYRLSEKKNALIWRGRVSGTHSDWLSGITWSESLLKNNNKITESRLNECYKSPRMSFLKSYSEYQANSKLIDLGVVYNKNELSVINDCPVKKNSLLALRKPSMSILEQLRYKFILAIPGNDYASNLYWIFLSNSIAFLLENEWETALDVGLEPWKHYVPVTNCIDDVIAKVERLSEDYELCDYISRNAYLHIEPYLDHDNRELLDYLTIKQYESCIYDGNKIKNYPSYSKGF